MDEFTDRQIRRIADNLERIADSLEKLAKPGNMTFDPVGPAIGDSVDPPPPPVRTS
jgi:hypothetical protein